MPTLSDLESYFVSIDAPDSIRLRTRSLLALQQAIFKKLPDHVLLENTPGSEGGTLFTGLACFVGDAYIDLPMPEPNWSPSISSFKHIYMAQLVHVQDFDFKEATSGSALVISVNTTDTLGFHLQAHGKNCMHLMQFAQDRIFPRLLIEG